MKKIVLKNFVDLSLDEKKMILSWRNNPIIKKWMYTSDDISLENHLSFIENLKTRDDRYYFLVQEAEEFIGVIDFTNVTSKDLDIGIYSNPLFKGKGDLLLKEIIKYSFEVLKVKKINAEVFIENEKAYSLYKRFNFKTVDEKIVNTKEVKCMELLYENR
ncbi:MAG TPA: UDP-4-amino-4,6-dideoxy-N-acetyl-beta-L-altrosamine N-acetyltransferase [Arcobacter sp.]|jgi:UDP-4-amino-4,6-dideoxy-N-acetyl-beta-L-altrosamine N-acetyltransferase|nr:UDP-4-amino-4,6-dideoxy-N-acetyl-beta-L-altrosamine N-acetyltransferase [Arcobacter sp.]